MAHETRHRSAWRRIQGRSTPAPRFALLTALLAILAFCACQPPPAPPVAPAATQPPQTTTSAQAEPPTVVTFGDSNVAFVAAQLPGTVHAIPGYSLDDWFPEMAASPAGAVVVVALGSNDVLEDDTAGDVAEAARLLARRCVVWVTPAQSSFDAMGEPFASRAAALIAEIEAQPHVVAWDTTLYQKLDPVHLTAEGYEAYAPVLAGAWSLCGGGS